MKNEMPSPSTPAQTSAPTTRLVSAESTDLLIWQLADSAFPTGGFAHSGGLEAAWQQGEIRNRGELAGFLEAALQQLGHAALPFVTVAYREPEKLAEWDQYFDVFTTSHVANRASRLQGRAFLAAAEKIFAVPALTPPCHHYAPLFGAVARILEISLASTMRLFFFQYLRGLCGSAVRLGIVGPMEAQGLQHRFSLRVTEIIAQCEGIAVDDAAQTAPLLELWQGGQDRLYSRLFQS